MTQWCACLSIFSRASWASGVKVLGDLKLQLPLNKLKSAARSSLVIPKTGLIQLISPKSCKSCKLLTLVLTCIFCGLIVCSVILHPKFFQGDISWIFDVETSSPALWTPAPMLPGASCISLCLGAAMSRSSLLQFCHLCGDNELRNAGWDWDFRPQRQVLKKHKITLYLGVSLIDLQGFESFCHKKNIWALRLGL